MNNLTKQPTGLRTKTDFMARNWRKALLLAVTFGGVLAMATYKYSVAGDPALLWIVIFTEVAAGVGVLAQALLRRVDAAAADKAFSFSVWARAAMALVGVALFWEAGTYRPEAVPTSGGLLPAGELFGFAPGAVTLTGLLTYEIGNGLMLLIEWMFSHLLAEDDYDARKEAAQLRGQLTEAQSLTAFYRQESEEADGMLAEIRSALAAELGDSPVRQQQIPDQVRALLAQREANRAQLQGELLALAPQSEALAMLLDALQCAASGKVVQAQAIYETYAEHPCADTALSARVLAAVGDLQELAKAQAVRGDMLGRVFTAGKNRQGFYCKSCASYSEVGRGKPKICKTCGTDQNA
jgi:hypothetical protein